MQRFQKQHLKKKRVKVNLIVMFATANFLQKQNLYFCFWTTSASQLGALKMQIFMCALLNATWTCISPSWEKTICLKYHATYSVQLKHTHFTDSLLLILYFLNRHFKCFHVNADWQIHFFWLKNIPLLTSFAKLVPLFAKSWKQMKNIICFAFNGKKNVFWTHNTICLFFFMFG